MPKTNRILKAEATRLRIEENLSYHEISELLEVPKATLSGWLRHIRLPPEILKAKMSNRGNRNPKKERGVESVLHQLVPEAQLTPGQKAEVAETAVLLRLILHGMRPFRPVFNGAKADWLIENPLSGQTSKIQVKWASCWGSSGLPVVGLRCAKGHHTIRNYLQGEFDFLVGYDYFTDTAYVWTWEEVKHLKAAITVHPDAAEAWHKIMGH